MSITIVHQETYVLESVLLKGEGPYSSTKILFSKLPCMMAAGEKVILGLNEPEFQFLASLIVKGWIGSALLIEFAELALEGAIPSELSREKLKLWLSWFDKEVRYDI